MLIQLLIQPALESFLFILNLLPDAINDIDFVSFTDPVFNIIASGAYFLPLSAVVIVFGGYLTLYSAVYGIRFLTWFWNLLPFT